jgi:tetratricopeptide (TPR) repeat protein
MKTCECLKWKYKGNGYLEAGKVVNAIDSYDNALATGTPDQEGIVLLMRANAYMQRASLHRERLTESVNQLTEMVPDTETLQTVYEHLGTEPALSNSLFQRILSDTSKQEAKFRQTQYRHGLYQYALLQASQDSLRSTQLLPTYADSWRTAADILSALWKLKESGQYYVRAIELDNTLSESLLPLIKRLQKRQSLLDNARAYGWSEDMLRLALDVAR